MKRKSPLEAKLYETAEAQQGLFTTKQAKACDYRDNVHPYHVRRGHWVREQRGIYRLARFPVHPDQQLVLWSLWSANRNEEPQGVYSHATALSIHELSDIMPAKLHLTVPVGFRRFRPPPDILVLHKANLKEEEIERRQGYSVTTPRRTLLDAAADETLPDHQVHQAVRDALRLGLVTRNQFRNIPPSLRRRLGREVQP